MAEIQSTEDSALTFKNILKLFKETDERLDKRFKETDERLDKRFKETDAKFKETDARLDKRFKETDARLDKQFKEVAEDLKKVTEDLKKTEQIVKETNRSIGALGNKWGEFIEGLVAPAAIRLFRERGFEVNEMYKRFGASKDGIHIEIDILVVDGNYAIVIEVKSTLGVEEVNDHLKRLADFKHFFPLYKEKKVLGAVAGIIIEDGVLDYAYKKGLFIIAQKGDTVQILNDEKFKANEW